MMNSSAVPIAEPEALAPQVVNFNAVSGSALTSNAFAQSLQSPIETPGK
jgi:uncharacterized protein with FMN-binding domain